MQVRRALVPLALAAAVLGAAGPAVAAWAVGSSAADVAARATVLQPPVAGAPTVTASTVTVAWSAPSSGAAPTGYTVLRTAPSLAAVCVDVALTACTDSGLSPSTVYTYALSSTRAGWGSTATAVSATTSAPSPAAFVVTVPATAAAGTSFTVTIQARNVDGSNDTTYTGGRPLGFSGPGTVGANAPVYPATAFFDAGGFATVTVQLFKAETVTLTVADGDPDRTGVSAAVTVAPGPPARLRWTSDAAGLVDACPTGTVVVGPNGQRAWYVGVLDTYGNRAVEGAGGRTVNLSRVGGGGPSAGALPNPSTLTVAAGASPAVTTGTTVLKLKKKTPVDTTYRATSAGVTTVSCTLAVV